MQDQYAIAYIIKKNWAILAKGPTKIIKKLITYAMRYIPWFSIYTRES